MYTDLFVTVLEHTVYGNLYRRIKYVLNMNLNCEYNCGYEVCMKGALERRCGDIDEDVSPGGGTPGGGAAPASHAKK